MLSSKRARLIANRFVVKAAIADRELLVVNRYLNRTRNRLANSAGLLDTTLCNRRRVQQRGRLYDEAYRSVCQSIQLQVRLRGEANRSYTIL